ncbi:MAG: choice-of-anchor P family protein [Mycobacteriales bacterium]|nr:choice-of-anchor P family protein [Mycobacteriales bacterium]
MTTGLRVGGAALLAAAGLVLLPAAPAQAAAVDGAFAEGAGLIIDTTLLAGNVPIELTEGATASSCLPQGAPATNSLIGPLGDAQVAEAAVVTSGASAVCTGAAGVPKALGGAQLTNVDALQVAAPVALHVDAITTTSQTDCTNAPTGSTEIVGLTIGGASVIPDGLVAPNTVVATPALDLLGIRIILNEQHPAANGRGLVVNGIHIIASEFGVLPVGGTVIRGDIIISHAVSGVVCANGRGSQNPPGVGAPDITFAKDATPGTAKGGTTVTYKATVTNTSAQDCEVLRFVDHLPSAVEFVSTAGPLGTAVDTPLPVRADGGQDAILRPDAVTIGAKASVVQTFVVKVKADVAPGTYYNNLELFCGPHGDFVSGPLAPITVPAPFVEPPFVEPPVVVPPVVPPVVPTLPRTGGEPLLALGALAAVGAAFGARRFATR